MWYNWKTMEKYKIAHFGTFDVSELDPEIIAIYNNDLEELKNLLGKKINKIIRIKNKYGEDFTALEMALYLNKKDIIYYLLEHNASNKGKSHPKPIEIAVRFCEPETIALFEKDLESLTDEKKAKLFQEIFWGENKTANIDALEKMGVTIAEYGGLLLRLLASENNLEKVQMFLEKGADINYHKPDMIFPYESTPVLEAARGNHFKMVQFLVEKGADITIKDKYGDRPYSVAVQNGNDEMIEFLTRHEPSEFHILENKNIALKSYKLPKKMIDFLQGDNLVINMPHSEYSKFIRFYSYGDTVEMTWKNKKVLSLAAKIDNYDLLLVWYPAKKMIYIIDYEHETFTPLATWEEFYLNTEKYISAYLNGECE